LAKKLKEDKKYVCLYCMSDVKARAVSKLSHFQTTSQ